MDESFIAAITQLESDLGLEPRFLPGLTEEGDWSFVIKAHALVEAALSHLLAAAVRDPRVTKIFQRMETSNETTGKLAFIKEMRLLPKRQRLFVKHLSELRNRLVHDVSNTSFDFDTYISSLDKDQRRKFREAFTWRVKPHPETPMDDWKEKAFDSAKLSIWVNLLLLLEEAYRRKARFSELMDNEDR